MLRLAPYLSTLTIQTKDAKYQRLGPDLNVKSEPGDFAWAQRDFVGKIEGQFNRGLPVRAIVLKARQLGLSTISEALLFWWCFLVPGCNSFILANENKTALGLFEKITTYWDLWPYNIAFSIASRTTRRLQWKETRSSIATATAKNLQSGRGGTFHALHATECAFYPDPETLMTGLRNTVPHRHRSVLILESTANGVGNWWHEEWLRAEVGDSEYVPCFYPWFAHYEYRSPTTLCTLAELTPDEHELFDIATTHHEFPISDDLAYSGIQWRRAKIRNDFGGDDELFRQEFPATADEAFITTGTNVFPIENLNACYAPLRGKRGILINHKEDGSVRFHEEQYGPMTIFKRPTENRRKQWDRYMIGGDPSMTVKGDPACIQVINRGTMEQVAVWHGNIDPIGFAHEMMNVGQYYHEAELCPEVEGGGQATIATLLNSGYPHLWRHQWFDRAPGKPSQAYGWYSNYNRKSGAISDVTNLLVDGSLLIHDPITYNQMRAYTVTSTWEFGPADRHMHDDAVMALCIAVAASVFKGPFKEQGIRDNNVFDLFGDEQAEYS